MTANPLWPTALSHTSLVSISLYDSLLQEEGGLDMTSKGEPFQLHNTKTHPPGECSRCPLHVPFHFVFSLNLILKLKTLMKSLAHPWPATRPQNQPSAGTSSSGHQREAPGGAVCLRGPSRKPSNDLNKFGQHEIE